MNKLKKINEIKSQVLNPEEGVWKIYNVSSCISSGNTLNYLYNNKINIIFYNENEKHLTLANSNLKNIKWDIYKLSNEIEMNRSLSIANYKNYTLISYISFKDFFQNLALIVIDNENLTYKKIEFNENEIIPFFTTSIVINSKGKLYLTYYDGVKNGFYIMEYKDINNIDNLNNLQKWHITKLDDNIGDINNLYLGKDDRLHIVYATDKNEEKKLVYINKPKVRFSKPVVIDKDDDTGLFLAVVEYDKNPYIFYYKGANLWYAFKNKLKWTNKILDNSTLVGKHISAKSDKKGIYVSYKDFKYGDLKFAFYDGNKFKTEFVESKGDIGQGSYINIDSEKIYISYLDNTLNQVKLAIRKIKF